MTLFENDVSAIAALDPRLQSSFEVIQNLINSAKQRTLSVQRWASGNRSDVSTQMANAITSEFGLSQANQAYLLADRIELSLNAQKDILWEGVTLIQLASDVFQAIEDIPPFSEKTGPILGIFDGIIVTSKELKLRFEIILSDNGLDKCVVDSFAFESLPEFHKGTTFRDIDCSDPVAKTILSLLCNEARNEAVKACREGRVDPDDPTRRQMGCEEFSKVGEENPATKDRKLSLRQCEVDFELTQIESTGRKCEDVVFTPEGSGVLLDCWVTIDCRCC